LCRTLAGVPGRHARLTEHPEPVDTASAAAAEAAAAATDAPPAAAHATAPDATALSTSRPLQTLPRGGIGGLYTRFEHLVHELGKFGIVGAVAYAVDLAIFNGLLSAGLEPLTSGTVSMAVAATVAFIGNRFWTWRDRERSGLHREYALYFTFNLGGLIIALTCLAISHYGLGAIWPVFTSQLADNVAKNLVGTALGTMFRFWSYRRFVFRSVR
jgi:putative flippase GtrA